VGECTWHLKCVAAVTYVFLKRSELPDLSAYTLSDVTVRYSAALRARTKRARWVQTLPRPVVNPYGPWEKWTGKWAKVRNVVDGVLLGRIPDPFPEALYFGGPMDPPSPRLREVGRAANIFYAVRSR
jgi:hypothetical protein